MTDSLWSPACQTSFYRYLYFLFFTGRFPSIGFRPCLTLLSTLLPFHFFVFFDLSSNFSSLLWLVKEYCQYVALFVFPSLLIFFRRHFAITILLFNSWSSLLFSLPLWRALSKVRFTLFLIQYFQYLLLLHQTLLSWLLTATISKFRLVLSMKSTQDILLPSHNLIPTK